MDRLEATFRKIERGTAPDKLESQSLEFKTVTSVAKQAHADLAEAAVCFANAVGGTVVIGVRDTPGGPDAFVGCELDPVVLRQRIHELTEPRLTVEVARYVHRGTALVVVTVPEGLEVYGTSKGVALRRIEDRCRPMRPDEVVTVAEERRGVDWTRRSSTRTVDDVERRSLDRLRQFVAASGRPGSERLTGSGDAELLHEMGLADRGRLSMAAELLLCRRADGVADDILVYQHRPTPGGEADAVSRWGTPMLDAYDEAMSAIRARQRITPVTLSSGVQMQVQDFPTIVVREALVNALVHGDHRYREPVRVVHSPDELTITSPGPLVSGVTADTILTRDRARFPLLSATFRRMGLAEDLGQGVDRMYRDMIKNGGGTPSIGERSDHVQVSLVGGPPNRRVAQFVQSLPAHEQDDTDCLLVIVLLCDRRTVSAASVSAVVQRSVEDAGRLLHRLATGPAELLEPTAGTLSRRHPNYRLRAQVLAQLGPAVRYQRRSRGELDRKVVAHVAEYGYINNSTLQRLFDVDVYQARDLLKDLVGREVLVRTSTQTRGKAVRYGAGPGFPTRGR